MTIEQAEKYYKQYDGHGFHMWREEPERYEEFEKLSISRELKKKWDDDLIRRYFETLWKNTDDVWRIHGRLIEILKRNPTEGYADRLLNEMEKMTALDKYSKILIIENMAGRDRALKGGCMLICTASRQAERMNRIMNDLMDFSCDKDDAAGEIGWTEPDARYKRAVSAYQAAYQKWK